MRRREKVQVDRTPPYLQVVKELRRQITDGELSDGDRVPSVRQLAAQWEISQATAMKALAALRADGLVESVVGVGTVVRTRRVHHSAADRFERALKTGKIYPDGQYAVITEASLSSDIPDWVRDLFGAEEGAQLIKRHRVTRTDEEALSASTSYFAAELAELAPQLVTKERIIGGTPSAIQEATGRRIFETTEATTVSTATDEQAEELGIPAGSPVSLGRNVSYDGAGDIIEVGESVSIPGRWRFHRSRH
ncbi:GntR family transcriptional regulator [Streptomyces sp. NPDC127098]|uniref:GntR family transcriptional regulator n=1 Tax=Streptomyces sp. NPDC127098 TaxID=3347137 RepID=UPI003660F89E